MRVLVTGGTGLVGSAIRELEPEWTYINSSTCNLLDTDAFRRYLLNNEPFDCVIHLAANVGGLFKNMAQKVKMFQDNLYINLNVIEACHRAKIPRMICCLSTCVFPDGLGRVMNENDLHLGEPHNSNFGYAYAKRMIDVHCRLINEDKRFFYQCIIPTNIYGPNDQFNDPESAHVVPALICKAASLQKKGLTNMTIFGTGLPKRQFIFSNDLARIIQILIHKEIRVQNLICSPNPEEECTILSVASIIGKQFDIHTILPEQSSNENSNDGQQIKTCSNQLLRSIIPEFNFTSLEEGIRQTCEWYKNNKTPFTL